MWHCPSTRPGRGPSILPVRLPGQRHRADGSLTDSTCQINLASVRVDNDPADAQAQARAALLTAARLVHAIEAIENTRQMLCRYADSCVTHDHARLYVLRLHAYFD